MDAVIAQYKPKMRVAHRPHAPWVSNARPIATPRSQSTTPEQLVPAGQRVVVLAPHPDDEVLALGATVAALARAGREVLIIAATDGEASHPHSTRWTPETLRTVRPHESELALRRLAISPQVLRLGLPDGGLPAHERKLAELLPLGSNDTVFVPWRHDGHPDHEACARAALSACRTVGARCFEFPVWSLVPSHAAHGRLLHRMLQRVEVPADLADAKRHAISAFASQLEPDEGTAAVLQQDALGAWQQGTAEWIMA
ncbi:PIG-L family deacetylase [Xylophilus rhododendri]|uniref:PIG-L family deacetylase n=1 Tax=Xylophilus rhododendri TaxID=2697032 RepID=A0A857J9K8_9BURK|nr:PIG-L deacetylase family protein [Xylophilus rhododendri]QHJ00711.1 PIG-L family deacetylase [Xylophilus rhododendri]